MTQNAKKHFLLIFKKLLIYIVLSAFFILFLSAYFFYSNNGNQLQSKLTGQRKVFISKQNGQYSFYKNGKPFIVKGGGGSSFLQELAFSGGNTIMCWDTSSIDKVLKDAAKFNIAVIIGLDVPGTDQIDFYKDEKQADKVYNLYSIIVNKHKDNPALLAWCLGNELAMKTSFKTISFFKSYNKLLRMIHRTDPQHPVATAVMDVPKMKLSGLQYTIPGLDFISINTYNGLKVLDAKLDDINFFWSGPYIVGEWAPNGGWEATKTNWQAPIENTSTKKAEQFADLYKIHMPLKSGRYLGSLAFYWGTRQEYTHTWYSVFSNDKVPNEITETLKDCWHDTITNHLSPKLSFMLVDSLGSADNIIFTPGTPHKASILLDMWSPKDTLHYKWQILKEDWQTWNSTWNYFKQIPPEPGLFKDSTMQHPAFITPAKNGPYRIYVTVYNSKGYCATANTPFYVEE